MTARSGPFRRGDRLRHSRDYRRASREGERLSSPSFIVLVVPRPSAATGAGARLGVTVSRRVGSAVVRNRVKRLIREWFRTQRGSLGNGVDLVVIARPGAAALRYAEADRELTLLLERQRRR